MRDGEWQALDDEALERLLIERWLYRGLLLGVIFLAAVITTYLGIRGLAGFRDHLTVAVLLAVALAAGAVAFAMRQQDLRIHRELRRRRPRPPLALVLAAFLVVTTSFAAQAPTEAPPGNPAPARVVSEIQQELDDAVRRFQAMDAPGVLAHVSEQYRTGPLTKRVLAEQLQALFAVHDAVQAKVRIDDVRMVGEQAWVYSTGDVTGRVRWLGSSVPVLSWQRELEVARREGGRWRLFGYQQ
jgi:hypothetical protein